MRSLRWSLVLLASVLASVLVASPAPVGSRATAQSTPAAPTAAAEMAPLLGPEGELTVELASGMVVIRLLDETPETGLPIAFTVVASDREAGTVPPTRIRLPEPGTKLGEFEVLGGDSAETGSAAPDPTTAAVWRLRTFGSGRVELPSFEVGIDDTRARTEARTIDIGSVAGLETDPMLHRDIAQSVPVERPNAFGAMWLVAAGFLVLAALLGLWWWSRRRRRPVPIEPADTWAIARLDELDAEDLAGQGRIQAFYFRLTDIGREFIERRFDLAAPDRTTRELVDEARRHPELGEDVARLLGNLLRSADMVKFAGDRPGEADCRRASDTLRRFVVEAGPRLDSGASASDPRDDADAARFRQVRSVNERLDRLEARS